MSNTPAMAALGLGWLSHRPQGQQDGSSTSWSNTHGRHDRLLHCAGALQRSHTKGAEPREACFYFDTEAFTANDYARQAASRSHFFILQWSRTSLSFAMQLNQFISRVISFIPLKTTFFIFLITSCSLSMLYYYFLKHNT